MNAEIKGAAGRAFIIEAQAEAGARAVKDACAALMCNAAGSLNGDACGACLGCKKAQKGIHPDIFWYPRDAKKAKMTADDAKEIVFEAQKTCSEAQNKVFVICADAQILAAQNAPIWQNALLKTLEEAQNNIYFFIICPNAMHLLPTVFSRCQLINLQANAAQGANNAAQRQIETLASKIVREFQNASKMLFFAGEMAKFQSNAALLFYTVADVARQEAQSGCKVISGRAAGQIMELCFSAAADLDKNANFTAVCDAFLINVLKSKTAA